MPRSRAGERAAEASTTVEIPSALLDESVKCLRSAAVVQTVSLGSDRHERGSHARGVTVPGAGPHCYTGRAGKEQRVGVDHVGAKEVDGGAARGI